LPPSRTPDCPHAEDSAERAVKKTFAILGVDIEDPKQVEEFRRDLRFAGDLRKEMAERGKDIKRAAIGLIVAGLLGALWAGLQIKFGGG
jgi:hypothetical protein